MKTPKLLCSIAALALVSSSAFAVETNPVGFVTVTVPANSDATLAVPMNRAASFTGVIKTISGNVITVSGTPNWTANGFVYNGPNDPGVDQLNTYAIQIASGAKEGLTAKITANTTGTNPTLTITLDAGEDLSGIGTLDALVGGLADQIDIMPYWTPATVAKGVPIGTKLLSFQTPFTGINTGNSEQFSCVGTDVWEDDFTLDTASDTPIKFGTAIILRNTTASPIPLSFVGNVPMSAYRIRLVTKASNTAQDNAFGFMSPIPESLSSVGNPNVPLAQQSANLLQLPVQIGDQILGFDNSAPGINKSSTVQYTWTANGWEDDFSLSLIDYNTKLQPGFGYIFRKAATPNATSVVWTRLPSYLQ